MKSLLISTDLPSEGYGSGQRLLSLKNALEKLGECRVLWLSNGMPEEKPGSVDYVAPSGIPADPSRLFWIFRHLNFGEFRANGPALKFVEEIRNEYSFDFAFCHFFRSTGAAPFNLAPCMLDADAMHDPDTLLTRTLWPVTNIMMNRCASKFGKVFLIRSDDDKVLHRARTELLPCISTTPATRIKVEPEASNVLFIGNPAWPPNREAIEFLIEKVVPRIKQRNPNFKLRLVGGGTDAYANIPDVSAGGFVDDLLAEYQKAAVVLCPIWSGRGANVKLAEALQYGTAIVASAHAAQGFEGIVNPGTDLLTAESKESFPDILCDLLGDQARMITLRQQAAMLGETTLTQDHIDNIVANAAREILSNVER